MRKKNKYKLTTERNKAKIIQAAQTLYKKRCIPSEYEGDR